MAKWHDDNRDYCRQRSKEYYAANKETLLKKQRVRYLANREAELMKGRERTKQLKAATVARYGGRCACCGETELDFLSIDHINGGGKKHMAKIGFGSGFYYWLKRNGYPSGYQVLCFNCNHAKSICGVCPHQLAQVADSTFDVDLQGDCSPENEQVIN